MPDIRIAGDNSSPITIPDNCADDVVINGSNTAPITIGRGYRGSVIVRGDNNGRIALGVGPRGAIVITGDNDGEVVIADSPAPTNDGTWCVVKVGGLNVGTVSAGRGFTGQIMIGDDNEGALRIGEDSRVIVEIGDSNPGELRIGDNSGFVVDVSDANERMFRAGNGCSGRLVVHGRNEGSITVGHGCDVIIDVVQDNTGAIRAGDAHKGYVRVGEINRADIDLGHTNQGECYVGGGNEGRVEIGKHNTGNVTVSGNDGRVNVETVNSGSILVRGDNDGSVVAGTGNRGLIQVTGDNGGDISMGPDSRGGVVISGDNDGSVTVGGNHDIGKVLIDGSPGSVVLGTGTPTEPRPSESIRAEVTSMIEWIKREAREQAARDINIDTTGTWYRRLLADCLEKYLANPSPKTGEAAIARIGRQAGGHDAGGGFNNMGIPAILGLVLDGLPSYAGAATWILNQSLANNIDAGFLLGQRTETDLMNDPLVGGRNQTQLLHWATGAKFHSTPDEDIYALFVGYEIWHREGWEAFGEDSINDLIAEEQGRLLAKRLLTGEVTAQNLEATILETSLAARAWVGSLVQHRRTELDAMMAQPAQTALSQWMRPIGAGRYPGETTYWSGPTLVQAIAQGMPVAEIRKLDFVQRMIQVYRLSFESERWQQAHGTIVHPPLVLNLLDHQYDTLLEKLAFPGFPSPGIIPHAFGAIARHLLGLGH